ncbi:MAG: ATP-binding protein, partial [Muribaculaceae bacterium]
MQRIVGRKEQVSELLHSYNSGKSEFVVLYGRRRVGKTFLVNEVFGDKFSFSHSGLAPFEKSSTTMLHDQLQNFYFSLVRYGMDECTVPRTWLEAFEMLRRLLEKCDKGDRQVVFIDEMPWMDTPRSGFLAALESFWNGWGCSRHNLMLIVCGSATSWIQNKLIDSRGGLYNRITNRIKVNAFTLSECEQLFSQMEIVLTRRDIVEAYMVTGGIPYYLSYFRKGLSLAQNIDRLFFAKEAKLSDEYSRLFSSLFVSPEEYEKIIEALSSRSYGLTRNEVSEKTGIANGGGLSLQLKALEESGFIKKYVPMGPGRKVVYYRVVDNFCLFWLRFKKG